MNRVFLYTSLLLLITCSGFSAPIQFIDDDLNDDDISLENDLDGYINNNDDILTSKLDDLGVKVESRSDSYKKVLTFIKSLQDSIDKEHKDLTNIFNGQTKEHNDRKRQLDEVKRSVKGLHTSLEQTQWKISNLTNVLSNKNDETSKVQKTINYHRQLLKEELEGINKFYIESDKYKKYKEFPEIKSQIDELKNSIHKEVNDVIAVYSKLGTKLTTNLTNQKKELEIFKQQEKTFNTSLNNESKQYGNLLQSFQKFVDLYNKNSKHYESAKKNYNEEKILLDQLSAYLQETNPEKCIQITQDYKDQSNKLKNLEHKNKELTTQIKTLHKEINNAVNKSKSVNKQSGKITNNNSGKGITQDKSVSQTKSKSKL